MHDAAGTFDVVVQTFRQQHCRTCPSENPICHELILMQFPHWISEAFPQLAPVQLVPCHHIVHTVFLTTLPHAIYARTCPERVRYRRVFLTTDGSGLLDGVSVSVLMEYRAHNEISMILLCGVDHGGDVIRFHVIVAVNEGDELASRHIQSGITGRGGTAVGLVNHLNTRILIGPSIAHCRAPVCAAVIYQNNLQVSIRLVHHATDASVEILFHPVYGDDDAY